MTILIIIALLISLYIEAWVIYFMVGNIKQVKKRILKKTWKRQSTNKGVYKPKENVIYKIHCPRLKKRKKIELSFEYEQRLAYTSIHFYLEDCSSIYFVNGIPCSFEHVEKGDFATFRYENYYEILYFNKKYVFIRFKNIDKFHDLCIKNGNKVEDTKYLDAQDCFETIDKIKLPKADELRWKL